MGVFDFRNLVQEYARKRYRNKKVHISLHRLKMTSYEPRWDNDFDSPDGASPKFTEHNPTRLETGNTLSVPEAVHELPCDVKVTFTKGQASGLSSMMKLVMPNNIAESGIDSITLPLDSSVSRHLQDVATVSTSFKSQNSHTVATYRQEWDEYKGHFCCTVSLRGKVIIERQENDMPKLEDREIAHIFEEALGDNNWEVDNVLQVQVDGKEVLWDVEGDII